MGRYDGTSAASGAGLRSISTARHHPYNYSSTDSEISNSMELSRFERMMQLYADRDDLANTALTTSVAAQRQQRTRRSI